MIYYYVYRITNTVLKKHYYGSRGSKRNPKQDLGFKYLSSSTDLDFLKDQRKNKKDYKYKVIRVFHTREDAVDFEIVLHAKFNVKDNPHFYNASNQTSKKFSTPEGAVYVKAAKKWMLKDDYKTQDLKFHSFGMVTVKDQNGKTSQIKITDSRYKKELISIQTGKVIVFDTVENRNIAVSKEVFNSSDRYVALSKDHIAAKNLVTGAFERVHKSVLANNDLYEHPSTGRVSVFDSSDSKTKSVSLAEFRENKNFRGVNAGKISGILNPNRKTIVIFDSLGTEMFRCCGDFKAVCQANKLPFGSLGKSYRSSGTPIFQEKRSLTDAKRNGTTQYVGWFAKEM